MKLHESSPLLRVCFGFMFVVTNPLKEVTDSLVAVLRFPKHEQIAAMTSLTQTVYSVLQRARPSLPTSRAGTVVLSHLRNIRICAAAAVSVAGTFQALGRSVSVSRCSGHKPFLSHQNISSPTSRTQQTSGSCEYCIYIPNPKRIIGQRRRGC